jgi:hypothetical protein
MSSSRIWRLATLVRTDVSEDRITSIIRVERIRELRTTLAITRNWLLFTANVVLSSLSFDPDDGGDTSLLSVDSYKSHTA